MFWIPGELSAGQKLAWAYLTYFSWGIAYTFVNIPYGSLASSMTQDAEEQAELSTWRTFGAICGTAITKFMVPIMLTFFADDVAFGYLAAVAACGMIGMLAHVSAYFGTKENIRPKPEPMTPLLTQVKQLFQNKLLLAVSASALCCLTALYGIGATTMFWIKANLDNALSVLAITGVVDVIAMIGMLFITKPLIKRFGIRNLVMMCCVVTITFNLTAYFLVSNPTQYLTFYIIDKLFSMFPVALMWGLVADCIEYSHYKTGKREAGVIYASYSLSRKLAGAMAGFIAAVGIGLIGYDPALAAQTEETQAGLQAMMFLMPAVANGLMFLIFALFWDLTPKKREEMVAHNQAMLKLGAQY
ncbi:hypothetical protein AAY53_05430 [Vibrio metoecus]|nr:hypothetical protein AAY53_05430 [Vibrio metoecus]